MSTAPSFRRTSPGLRRAALLSLALWSVGYVIYVFVTSTMDGMLPDGPLWLTYLGQYAIALGLSGLLIVVVQRLPDRSKPMRWTLTAASVLALTAILALVDNASLIFYVEHVHPEQKSWAYWHFTWWLRTAFLYFWVFCLNATLVLLAFAIEQVRAGEREVAELRATAAQAQLAMLRYQLNPHFLFNTLNAISSLVVTGRVQSAEAMIERLSSFLRETLSSDPAGLVTVEDELSLAQDYLAIEGVRFGERLRVAIECDRAAGGRLVPSFILQPLVENAVKHGVGPSITPVTIALSAAVTDDGLILRVCDDGRGGGSSGTGVGLRNTRDRLSALYRGEATILTGREACGYVVELRLPCAPDRDRQAA